MLKARVVSTLSLLLLATAVAFSPAAFADSQVRIVRLSLVDGAVQIDRAAGNGFEKAIANMPVVQGTRLRTEADGRAEVEFENGTNMRLSPSTDIEFAELSLRDSGEKNTLVKVVKGTAYFDVHNKREDNFRLVFGNQQLAFDHSAHFRVDVGQDSARLAVFKGELSFNDGERQSKLKKNQTLTINLQAQEPYAVAKGVTSEPDDAWDAKRVEYQSYYATASSYNRSPYYYGRSDLNYYGQWASLPGYGAVWRPYGVGYGWDPFYGGAWSWYPGAGYTWISAYPWGWTPYRYGSWVFVSNYGWCWRPGGWNAWRPVTPVFNSPATYKGPTAPVLLGGNGTPVQHPTVIVPGGGFRHFERDNLRQRDSMVQGSRVSPGPGVPGPRTVNPAVAGSPFPGARHVERLDMDRRNRAGWNGTHGTAPMSAGGGAAPSAQTGAPARASSPPPAVHSAPHSSADRVGHARTSKE